jgi:F-type H+-transporting ATPase subunit delta
MAELATIARPYAEALFKAIGVADAQAVSEQVNALAAVAADAQVRQFADNPKAQTAQVFDLITSAVKGFIGDGAKNLLRAVIDNGRLAALPEIAAQYHALVNERTGVSDAVVESAFAIGAAQLAEVKAALEKRFGRSLNASVVVKPELIGGIRVVVGDEVLDTSVRARLEQMKTALVA